MGSRTPPSRTHVIAFATIILVGIGVVAFAASRGPERHGDGAGPLGSYGSPGYEGMRVDPSNGTTTWTYGVALCLAEGDLPAILRGVEPLRTVGAGFEDLGSAVRTFTMSQDHTPIISVEGWPPPRDFVPDSTVPVIGAVVTNSCRADPSDDMYTELLIGLGKRGSDGGGWEGIAVTYEVGGREFMLELDHDLQICGTSTSCDPPFD